MTELAELERALTTALGTIRDHWDALVAQGSSGLGGTASSDVVTGLDRRISLRHEVTLSLSGWARLIVEERPLSRGLPLGTDALGMVELIERHARWFSGHEAAQDAADELTTWANEVRAVAAPTRRDWIYLGDCPFVVEDWFCAGQVRGYSDPDRLPGCTDCGQEAVVEWWEDVLDVSQPIARDELLGLIKTTTGRTVSRFTVTRWIRNGRIPISGTDEHGKEVFDRRTVAAALTRQESA
jgi:hypothetical protein